MASQITPFQEVSSTLQSMGEQFKMVLPIHIKPDKFVRASQTAIQKEPDLLALDRPSLYNALMSCAQDGLIPDGREAVITKKGGKAVYMPMIGGILKLIRNSGELGTVDADVVREKDEYDAWVDEKGQHFKHKKARGDRGTVLLTYAYAITKDGHLYFEEVSNEEMASIQKSAGTQAVWTGPFREEMMKKSALRRMGKRMPKSTDIEEVFKSDDEAYALDESASAAPAEKTTSSKLAAAVGATDAEVVTPTAAPTAEPAPQPTSASQPAAPAYPSQEIQSLKGVLIERLSVKNSPPESAKKWTKYGGLVDNKWYGTFDKKLYDIMDSSVKSRALVNIQYHEIDVRGSIFYEIDNVEVSSLEDVQPADNGSDDGVPI